MKIFVHNGKFIDFEAPVFMNDQKFERFLKMLREDLSMEVDVKKVTEPDRYVNVKERGTPREWTADDYYVLLIESDNVAAANMLKRSDMAVIMKRGEFVPAFLKWAQKHSRKPNDKTAIADYLKTAYG